MPAIHRAILAVLVLALATPADAQLLIPIPLRKAKPQEIGPPKDATPYEAEVWPFPAPDPKAWWDDKWPKAGEEADPFGGRRVRRGERLPTIDNGVDASTYRLWGLMPLQWQLLRGDEMIFEVWTRPTGSVRQTVTRVSVRGDERVFVQGRAGLACCEAGIGRRLGFDRELPAGSADRFRSLRDHWVWKSPRDVRVAEAGAAEAVCVEGVAYDLTLLTAKGARTVRRACDLAEVGEGAEVLEAVIGASLGQDPRYDLVFRGGADFSAARTAYRQLIESGGQLKPDAQSRFRPPGQEPAPQPEVEAATPAPGR
ncbi:hypothetical protein ACO2Q0_16055 [Phenylobacterium sp. VNQ135]|uniref:hypothetical protein n=1 Tax=Phenylobacterium sp. VNQ135 TaxID=3400922 RepID=UPI003C083459